MLTSCSNVIMNPCAVRNMSVIKEFILLGFSFPLNLAPVFFLTFLLTYLLTMAGNFLILSLFFIYHRLQKPMYFFLCNLAILDICFSSAILPNFLRSFFVGGNIISRTSCLGQSYIYFFVGAAQFLLLAVMSFDRYVAICHPLNYPIIMQNALCIKLVAGSWLGSFFCSIFSSVITFKLLFCFNELNHFFCDIGPLLMNSCTDITIMQLYIFVSSSLLFFTVSLITGISYAKIVMAILKIQSRGGRERAISTCSSHAIVMVLFFGSCSFMYLKPIDSDLGYDKKLAILNTVIVPLLNPYIYTLRNQAVKDILKGWR